MKTIVFFIPTLDFVKNWIDPLYPFLEERGFKIVIMHINSLNFGIAKNTFDVVESILHKKELFIPASVVLNGEYGANDVAMGVPVKIDQNGISEIQKVTLDDIELSSLKKSSEKIYT